MIFVGLTFWFVLSDQLVLAGVSMFCLVAGTLVSYSDVRAEGLGMTADVGLVERPERLVAVLVPTGLDGLGVPYILAAGLWLLAAASAVTVGQRLLHVYRQTTVPTGSAPPPPIGRAMTDKPSMTDRLVAAGFAAGWAVVPRLPERLTAGAFRVGADQLWRRRGKSVLRLESNLSRVTGLGVAAGSCAS